MTKQTVAERITGQPGTWRDAPLYQTLPGIRKHLFSPATFIGDEKPPLPLAERLRSPGSKHPHN